MPHDIRLFFDSYRDAFNRLDGEAVARFYHLPSGIRHGADYTGWTEFAPIADNMVKLCRAYADNGFVSASYAISSFLPQGEFASIVDLVWTIERTGSLTPWRFHTSYNLIRTSAGWRVLLCTAYEEQRHKAST